MKNSDDAVASSEWQASAARTRLESEFLHQFAHVHADLHAFLGVQKARGLLFDETHHDFERLPRFLWACRTLD